MHHDRTHRLPVDAAPFNAKLRAEVEKIISPRPKVPSGSNWQTPHDLHTRPAFADLANLIEIASKSVAEYLHLERFPMMITGCWANVNPPGSYHPTHNHPNNFLSGVYYVDAPGSGTDLVFVVDGETSTTVYRMNGTTGAVTTPIPNSGRRIVGAGVSTCAPIMIE